MLRFRPGYTAGTRPRVLSSVAPKRYGEFIRTGRVNHPGITARDFDVEVAEQIYPDFVETVNDAISLGIEFAE
jgi:hypothetical protein